MASRRKTAAQPKRAAQRSAPGGQTGAGRQTAPARQTAQRGRPQSAAQGRNPWPVVLAGLSGVVIAILVFLALRYVTTPAAPPAPPPDTGKIVAQLTGVPASEMDSIGQGTAQNSLQPIRGAQPLVGPDGKPEVFFMGAEYCPYCAAQRWATIVALSRFGTFSGLRTTTSSATDVYPNTPTFTFHGSSYSSQYLDFVPVETETNQSKPLDQPTSEQQALVNRYDTGGGIPFVDFGNRYEFSGAMYTPDVLKGMSWQQIASAVQDPSSPQAKAILGSANLMTAATCQATGQQPAPVCSSAAIQSLETRLPR